MSEKFICTNCGMCCIDYDVIIIDPNRVSENIDLTDTSIYIHKPSFQVCPHLYWEDDESRCKIHHYSWYKKTPCFQFTQIGGPMCRLGEYFDNKFGKGYYKKQYENNTRNPSKLY